MAQGLPTMGAPKGNRLWDERDASILVGIDAAGTPNTGSEKPKGYQLWETTKVTRYGMNTDPRLLRIRRQLKPRGGQ